MKTQLKLTTEINGHIKNLIPLAKDKQLMGAFDGEVTL